MTAAQFRAMALALPGASEASHHGHPDFRVAGKVFATLDWPARGWGMVRLRPEDQDHFVRAAPATFSPVRGTWGRQGCTSVKLRSARVGVLRPAIEAAWHRHAPARLRAALDRP